MVNRKAKIELDSDATLRFQKVRLVPYGLCVKNDAKNRCVPSKVDWSEKAKPTVLVIKEGKTVGVHICRDF